MDFEKAQLPRESDFRLFNLYFVNLNPNIEYLLRNVNMDQPLFDILMNKHKGRGGVSKTNEEGWGVRIDTPVELNPDEVLARFKKRIKRNALIRSAEREAQLESFVHRLKNKGTIVLVRMPLPRQVWMHEQETNPFLDSLLIAIAEKEKVAYLNYAPAGNGYSYHDGMHHLDKESAVQFSKVLAQDIQEVLD